AERARLLARRGGRRRAELRRRGPSLLPRNADAARADRRDRAVAHGPRLLAPLRGRDGLRARRRGRRRLAPPVMRGRRAAAFLVALVCVSLGLAVARAGPAPAASG